MALDASLVAKRIKNVWRFPLLDVNLTPFDEDCGACDR